MPQVSGNGPFKRKRVAKACQNCRLMKAKCNGALPVCSRCEGYGYQDRCTYRELRVDRGISRLRLSQVNKSEDSRAYALQQALMKYENLLHSATNQVPEPEQAKVKQSLGVLQADVQKSLESLPQRTQESRQGSEVSLTHPPVPVRVRSNGYHGEVSDVRFYNAIRKVLDDTHNSNQSDQDIESYEQDTDDTSHSPQELPIGLPTQETTNECLDIYFSTIHLAYPFVPQSSFYEAYHKLRKRTVDAPSETSWLATFYNIIAIGSYYKSFTARSVDAPYLHQRYFQHASSLIDRISTERSFEYVSLLLTKCFYLLAVGLTESCWVTLGTAIRIGQSIGLHVQDEEAGVDFKQPGNQRKRELDRRLWYSLYVLDRLLALQLGRPPAIQDEDCHVPLPLRVDDVDTMSQGSISGGAKDAPMVVDYFLSIIYFSKIIGNVLREIYNPLQNDTADVNLDTIKMIDERLREWKFELPRILRFDLGHTFEKSALFKRQRNMLATKYHHLRALIHRRSLSVYIQEQTRPRLFQHSLSNRVCEGVLAHQRICISEAQEIAHLLHNVTDTASLIQDFPWWQMISCLICASSILFVASTLGIPQNLSNDEMRAYTLREDAETCLKVFEALSSNSAAARMARDMLGRLKNKEVDPVQTLQSPSTVSFQALPLVSSRNTYNAGADVFGPAYTEIDAQPQQQQQLLWQDDTLDSVFCQHEWPSEILDPLMWSTQFLDFNTAVSHETNSGFESFQ